MIEQMQGLPLPGPKMHALPAPKKKPTGYIADPDKGTDYQRIPDKYKKVSELVEIKNDADRLHELRKARDMAATEARNYGYKARGVERRGLQNEETEEEKTLYHNTKENLQKYYKNIEAYNEAERLRTAKPTEGTGFQTSRHPYKMTKDGKYGKLTIDVPQLVEKHRLLAKEAGVVLLDEKVDSHFIDLISKRYDTKKKYSNLSKIVFKTLTDLSGLENKKRSKKFKNIIKGGCIPTFYNDSEDLLSLLELIIGSIGAGNDNSKMKNRGMAIYDELLKL